ncbi:MAG: OprO/OprP family phosphate-selective porin [Planctomycetota bacterium]|nr:OprO/OprP family phosphate-selective porin [Planctomycetota bacterium]
MPSVKAIICSAVAGTVGLCAIARGDLAATAPPSGAAVSSNVQMQAKIQALEGRINELESQEARTQADVTAAIHDVLADADKRSKLMSVAPMEFPTGYDSNVGFVLQSADGNFSMHPGALFQFRNQTSYRTSIPAGGGGETASTGTDTQNGFNISRMRFTVDGNLYSPNLMYYFQVADDNAAGSLSLLDAYVTYRLSSQSPLAVKFGQFKDPVWHEENVLPGNQLTVDRSLANAFLGSGQDMRVQGLGLIFDEDEFRGQAVFHDGYASTNTKFFDAGGLGAGIGAGAGVTPTNWGATVRAEYMVIGERTPEFNPFSEYDQFSAQGDKQNILVVGAGADYSESGSDSIVFHTLDAQYNTTSGWGIYGAYLGAYRSINSVKGAPLGHFYDSGFLLQAGYMLTSRFEPFVRYDYTHLDGQAVPTVNKDSVQEVTIGANYYFYGQHAKVTVDGTWLPNGSPTDVDMLGILKNDGHDELVLQVQFQLEI